MMRSLSLYISWWVGVVVVSLYVVSDMSCYLLSGRLISDLRPRLAGLAGLSCTEECRHHPPPPPLALGLADCQAILMAACLVIVYCAVLVIISQISHLRSPGKVE